MLPNVRQYVPPRLLRSCTNRSTSPLPLMTFCPPINSTSNKVFGCGTTAYAVTSHSLCERRRKPATDRTPEAAVSVKNRRASASAGSPERQMRISGHTPGPSTSSTSSHIPTATGTGTIASRMSIPPWLRLRPPHTKVVRSIRQYLFWNHCG